MTACDVLEEDLGDLLDGPDSDGTNRLLARHVETCEGGS